VKLGIKSHICLKYGLKAIVAWGQIWQKSLSFCANLYLQEAQLSQRDRAMLRGIEYFDKPLKVTKGHSKWHPRVYCACWYFMVTMSVSRRSTVSQIFSVKSCRDLEIWVTGRSRSLKTTPFDRPCSLRLTTGVPLYKCSSVSYHFPVTWHWIIRDLEVCAGGHSRSLKNVPLESLDTVCYSLS